VNDSANKSGKLEIHQKTLNDRETTQLFEKGEIGNGSNMYFMIDVFMNAHVCREILCVSFNFITPEIVRCSRNRLYNNARGFPPLFFPTTPQNPRGTFNIGYTIEGKAKAGKHDWSVGILHCHPARSLALPINQPIGRRSENKAMGNHNAKNLEETGIQLNNA